VPKSDVSPQEAGEADEDDGAGTSACCWGVETIGENCLAAVDLLIEVFAGVNLSREVFAGEFFAEADDEDDRWTATSIC